MDARFLKITQLWMLSAQSGEVPKDQIAGAVYFGVTGKPPPPEVMSITTALGLCEYFHKQETGRELAHSERILLAQEMAGLVKAGRSPSLNLVRLVIWLPNIALILAAIAIIFGQFSWIVLVLGAVARFQSGFARYLSGGGHPAAGGHVVASIILVISSIVVSLLHLFSGYRFL